MAERGVTVDHATLNRWVVKFSPSIAANAQARKRATANSWRMDETYITVKGMWTYLYRAVDRNGQTLDFMLAERRDLAAARRFFKQAIGTNGVPDRVVIDKSGANLARLQSVNVILKFTGTGRLVTMNRPGFTGGQNSRRIARYGTDTTDRRRPRSRIYLSSASVRFGCSWNTAMNIRARLRR